MTVAGYLSPLPSNPALAKLFLTLRRFFAGKLFMWLSFAAAAVFVALGAEVVGVATFVLIIALILTVSDDIIPTTFPFLLICISVLQCYDSFNTFIGLWWLAIPVISALVFHFVYYRRPILIGKTFYGIAAVSVAVTLGGLGSIDIVNYAKSAYYVLGLGAGMMVSYILIKSQLEIHRDYDLRERFVDIMYMAGLFTCFQLFAVYAENYISLSDRMSLWEFIKNRDHIGAHEPGLPYYPSTIAPHTRMLQCGNNISTFIMFFLPFPFYRARQGGRSLLHLGTALLMMITLFLSGSRGGMLLGSAEFLICTVAMALTSKAASAKIAGWSVIGVSFAVAITVILVADLIPRLASFITNLQNEPRGKLMELSLKEFTEAPLFGKGLGNPNVAAIYDGKAGTMKWYHMMIPQIIGSMGAVGILGYGYQIFKRIREVICRFNPYVMTLGLSYLGVLLITQVNPGEFCPLPYELMAVMLFIMIEKEPEREKIKNKRR